MVVVLNIALGVAQGYRQLSAECCPQVLVFEWCRYSVAVVPGWPISQVLVRQPIVSQCGSTAMSPRPTPEDELADAVVLYVVLKV